MEQLERLQKVMAAAGVASRRKSEELILAGRVKVNGEVARELGTKVSTRDKIEVNGMPIAKEQKVYILLNKPRGCVTTVSDEKGRKTVLDYTTAIKERIYPVGRLDYDTAGVLLLTNDGDFANAMMHPKGGISKTYRARVHGVVPKDVLHVLRKGVKIEDYVTSPAEAYVIDVDKENDSTLVELTIFEGRYHQVKKMFEAVGHPVKRLRRHKFAFLDVENVAQGTFRYLTGNEVRALMKLSREEPQKRKPTYVTQDMRQY